MSNAKPGGSRIKVSFGEALGLIGPYVKQRFFEQIKSVALIILYLIFFQTLVLGIPIAEAGVIAAGLALVVVGLTFFMEGLLLGLMPLGETIGIRLPQKSSLPVILIFAFILGMGATYAEPAIGVLRDAGRSVEAWRAPLLFTVLNKHAETLVISVGAGVGLAVIFGMLRFLYNWSLKPFIFLLVTLLLGVTAYAFLDDNMRHLIGLAWDCGAVTTGPVTVPLVLALGIGISRVAGSGGSGSAGFGVVTLASLFPIIAVLSLGVYYKDRVPAPQDAIAFFSPDSREAALELFADEAELRAYALSKSSYAAGRAGERQPLDAAFADAGPAAKREFLLALRDSPERQTQLLGKPDALQRWTARHGDAELRALIFGEDPEELTAALARYAEERGAGFKLRDLLERNAVAAARAILPLTLFLIFVLVLVLREKLPRADEILLGVFFATLGMGVFNIGIELGLTKLGNQVGGKLPASFTSISLEESRETIRNFSPDLVRTAIDESGERYEFFYRKDGADYEALPYESESYDPEAGHYVHTPLIGPLFGKDRGLAGIIVVLLFAFVMGYGATLAEPALNALGLTVEELTVGAFRKSFLMQAVAIGVGVGIALGVARIIYDFPLIYILAPPYLFLLFITAISTEEFVNIGWDSAGVTTGPITVPLVLAMGLGIGGQSPDVIEGFGILSMASVCPILSVLLVGLHVARRRRKALAASAAAESKTEAAEAIA